MYNKVILEGNLTKDIETANEGKIAKSAIAVNRKWTNKDGEKQEDVLFVDVTFFGKPAEIAVQYLKKGSRILIDGRLVFEQWENEAKEKRSKHTVTVESFQMLDAKSESETEKK
jgi:single-strand DNA-binding protein